MDSILVRVDNRLVHGQILEAWVPSFKAVSIIVVNDEVARDLFRESVIRMVVPSYIKLYVFDVEEFSKSCSYNDWKLGRSIILFDTIGDALRAYNLGFAYDRINIGNVHDGEGKCCVSSSIFLDRKDAEDLKTLVESGVTVEIQCIPNDRPVDFRDVEEKIKL
ncbi:MAG: PTS sugar transporter subunit IIB [Deltaproteobacteria bacterium]|mgnify:FL=1|nr:PTS sugar transporter subunit IIB [Deltaproteobacteria bacterium]MBN2846805.1 PTS sugar transporter subunit IIB [Deltaproteobacteria bacterium]